jgi:hypothetical protein
MMMRAALLPGAAWVLLALLFLPSPVRAQSVCLTLETEEHAFIYPLFAGDQLSVTFPHSLYGSLVQEQFRINRRGFETIKLRYAEKRLAEFYGHDSAILENGWWVVDKPGGEHLNLGLRVSRESFIRIEFRNQVMAISDGAARLSAGTCAQATHG